MADEYLLGVDIGTYSSKGVLADKKGDVICSHILNHGVDMPKPGYFEHDADKIWWHDFVEIIKNLLIRSNINSKQIIGIGISAIGASVLPVDKQGKPLRPAILYGIDTRATNEIEYIEEVLGRDNIFNKSGFHLDSQSAGPKILWIRNHEPSVYKKTRWFLTSQAYLVYRLTGEASIDMYTASEYAPLFDIYKLTWYEDASKYICPVSNLPKPYWSCDVVGKVSKEAAVETGLAEGIPVIAGTTDAAAEAISAGMSELGDMMLMFGSSLFFIIKTNTLVKTNHFWSSNFLEKNTYAFLGGMSTSGSLITWFRDQFAQEDVERQKSGGKNAYASLTKLAAKSSLGAGGLIVLPYFEGERTPIHDPKAKGMIFGLSLKNTRCDVYRAILESVGFGIRHNIEVMFKEGVSPKRILAVGGGTKNSIWMKIVSNITNIEMNIPKQQIGASFGDAFMAGVGIGLFSDLSAIAKWVKIDQVIAPDLESHKSYDMNYKIFRSLYELNKPLMHELSDFLTNVHNTDIK